MNLFELQERLKDFSQEQLVREMQAPTGTAPQFLVLSELQRRQRMMAEEQAQMQTPQTTVAEDAIAAAGVPQGGLADMARSMAPQTDMDMNTAVQPVERMNDGGSVDDRDSGFIRRLLENIRERARNSRMTDEEAAYLINRRSYNVPEFMSPVAALRDAFDLYEEGDYPGAALNAASAFPAGRIVGPALNVYAEMYNRSGDDDVEGMAGGGVVRMQPGGLAGISRDLDVYSPEMVGPGAPRTIGSARSMQEMYDIYGTPRTNEELQMLREQLARNQELSQFKPTQRPNRPSVLPLGADSLLSNLGLIRQPVLDALRALTPTIQQQGMSATAEAISNMTPAERAALGVPTGLAGQNVMKILEGADAASENEAKAAAAAELDVAAAIAAGEGPPPELVFSDDPALSFGDQFGEVSPAVTRRGGDDELTFGDIEPTGAPIPFALPTVADEDTDPDADVEAVVNGGGGAATSEADDAFEQDKWLALAQAGLALMSSQQPTIGGAIGEAGLSGITALRQARGERDERIERQQARADRLAAAAAEAEAAAAKGIITGTERATYFKAAQDATKEAEDLALDLARGGVAGDLGITPYTEEEKAALQRRLNDARDRATMFGALANPALINFDATREKATE
jgi:hypothetical protein